ncbi:hypothetical protein U5903_07110 [Cereibacter johrii]|uniref:hypothetical protein n=1 Tax=Cereibacter johrii TaxID=445629 RepID=UPI002B261CA2|nr:hypothetical protein [Cereibacter johrii]MEA5160542.1 hypothetical protein [Cereibacter johrii]
MCNTKDLAVTKIEKLTAAMHRLAAAMEGHVANERHDQPTEAPVHTAACSASACASEVGNGGGVLSTFFDGEDLDPGILPLVIVLRDAGIETYESCQGGEGHAYPEPTIRFHGDRSEGHKALAAALSKDLPVRSLRRIWTVIDGEATGPYWEIVFKPT